MESDPAPVLVVTDDPELGQRVDEAVRSAGLSATRVPSPQGLEQKAPEGPDGGWDGGVVLLDLATEGVDLETVDRLDDALGLPLVALTPTAAPDRGRAILERGAQEHLPRDEDRADVLLRTVQRARERRSLEGDGRDEASLLESTLESVGVGVLVVDSDGNVLRCNDRFQSIWGLDDEVLETGDDARLLEEAKEKLEDPEAFLEGVDRLYGDPTAVSRDLLRFDDGRVVERRSRPHRLDGEVAGRVWTFRDVTERERTEEALRESEARFRSLYENASIGLYRTSPEGEALLANPAMVEMLGYDSLDELVENVGEGEAYHPEYDREAWKERLHEEGEIEGLEATWTRRDGEEIRVRESTRVVRDDDGEVQYYEGTVEDITDRWKAKRELANRNELLEALHDVSVHILEHLNVDDVLEEIVERASDLLGTEHGWIFLRDGDDLELRYTTPDLADHQGLVLGRGEGHAGVVWDRGEPMTLEGYDDWDGRTPDFPEGLISSLAGVPLSTGGELRGVLGVGHREAGETFDEEELETLERLATLASVALENARLVDDMQAEIRERRETEEALRRSEERYRTLVDAAPDAIYTLNLEGTIESLNPAFEDITGWAPEEWEGRSFEDLIHPDDLDQAWENLAAIADGKDRVESEFRFRTRDGEAIVAHLVASPRIVDGEIQGVIGIGRDVTDRKDRERRLAESEHRLRRAQEIGDIGHWTWDPEEDDIQWSDQLHEIWHIPVDEEDLSFEDIREWIHPDDLEGMVERVERALEEGEPYVYDHRILQPDGSIRWLESRGEPVVEDGEVVALRGTSQDVTEKKRSKKALEERTRRLETLVSNLPGVVYRCRNEPGWPMDYFRGEAEELTGYPSEAIEDGDVAYGDVIHPDDQDMVWEQVQESVEAGEPFEIVYRIRGHEDGPRWVWERGRAIEADGGVEVLEGFITEITEQKETEAALRESQARLQEAQRVAQVGSWHWDIEPDSIDWSDEQRCLLGVPEGEVPDPGWEDFIEQVHPNDRGRVAERFVEAAEERRFPSFEFRCVGRDGSVRWLETRGEVLVEDGEVVAMRGTTLDITERVLPLRQYESLVQASPDAIVQADEDGEIVGWNEGAQEMFGYAEEEAVGEPLTMIMPEEYREAHREGLQRYLETEEANVLGGTVELEGRRADGSVFPVELTIDTYTVGDARYFSSIIRDVTERKEAQEELRRSEERYRNLVEAAPDVIYTLEPDGTILSLNEAFEDITGWAPEEWEGRHFSELVLEEDMEKAMSAFQRLRDGEEVDVELRFETLGDPVVGHIVGLPLMEDGEVDRFLGIARDITERREALEQLRRSEARYRRLVEGAPDPICTLEPDGTVASVNRAWEEETGLTLEDLGDVPFEEALHPEDRADAVAAFRRVLDGERAEAEFRVQTTDGDTFWGHGVGVPLYEDGEVDKVLGVIRNITELKETEDRLRTVKNFNEILLEHAPVGIAHVAEDGSLTYQNRELRRLRGVEGREADDLRDTPILDFAPIAEREELHARIQGVLKDGEPFSEYQAAFETAEGDEVHLAVSGVPIEGGGGDVAGAILLARDVTEERQLEREVERQTVQLVHSEKMAALGHLVAGIAHEINNPLSVVKSNTELIQEGVERMLENPVLSQAFQEGEVDPDAVLEEVVRDPDIRFLYEEAPALQERNLESLERIADFIESLRTFSAPDEARAPVDLNDALEDTVELFLAQYREEVELRTDWGDLPPVPCDESQVGQVAMNLLLNAAQASGEGDPVTLRTYADGDRAVLEVADEGEGIPEDDQDDVFDPFFTTKEDDNMGLGLSISDQIVSDHGGSIDLESTPGVGTVFRVRLPTEEGDA